MLYNIYSNESIFSKYMTVQSDCGATVVLTSEIRMAVMLVYMTKSLKDRSWNVILFG